MAQSDIRGAFSGVLDRSQLPPVGLVHLFSLSSSSSEILVVGTAAGPGT